MNRTTPSATGIVVMPTHVFYAVDTHSRQAAATPMTMMGFFGPGRCAPRAFAAEGRKTAKYRARDRPETDVAKPPATQSVPVNWLCSLRQRKYYHNIIIMIIIIYIRELLLPSGPDAGFPVTGGGGRSSG